MFTMYSTHRYDEPDDPPLSQVIIEAVAEAEGISPDQLDRPLHNAIDPDALDALFAERTEANGYVVFDYYGYDITVHPDEQIALEPVHD